MPLTTDDKKEIDETFIFEEDDEVLNEEKFDEFASFFDNQTKPKILLTTSERASAKLYEFLKEIVTVFPNCYYYPRRTYNLKEISIYAANRNYTDVMV